MTEWLASHSTEALVSVVIFVATFVFHAIWWAATLTERVRRTERDIDGVADVVGTERAKARRKKD